MGTDTDSNVASNISSKTNALRKGVSVATFLRNYREVLISQ